MPAKPAAAHFEERVAKIREALNDPAHRVEAAELIRSLTDCVTIEVEGDDVVADIEASTALMIDFSQNAEQPPSLVRLRLNKSSWLRGQDLNL